MASDNEQRELEALIARQAARGETKETPFVIEGKRVCLDCFEPIAARRLKANPDAVRCIGCQQDKESGRGID